MRNLGHEGKGRLYPPVSCRFLGSHQFAVVSKDHARIGMAHFEREPRCVFEMRQVVAGATVPQSIEGHFFNLAALRVSNNRTRRLSGATDSRARTATSSQRRKFG